MRNSVSFLLAFLMLSAIFASCAKQESGTTAQTTSVSIQTEETAPVETQPIAEVPEKNYNGFKFRILDHQNQSYPTIGNFEFWSESLNGEVVNDAVYTRNSAIEERFNVKITEQREHDTTAPLLADIRAGDEAHDLFVILHKYVPQAMFEGCMYDVNTIPYIDLEKPWWSRELGSGMTINGRLYVVSGDLLLYEKMRTYCILFNKQLVNDNKLSDPYEAVFDGKWTLDAMRSMMQGVSADLNGDGEMKPDDDCFGLVLSAYANSYGFLIGADINPVTRNGDKYELTLYNDRLVSVLDKLLSLTADDKIFFAAGTARTGGNWSAHSIAFKAGRALFNSSIVSGIKSVAQDSEIDFGVLPMPKFDEAQEYYRTSSDREMSGILCVPSIASEPERTGILLEAMAAESHYTTRPAYIETAIKSRYAQDENTTKVMDIIFDNTFYNLGLFFNLGDMHSLLIKIVENGENNIASSYKSIESAAQKDLDDLIEFFNKAE